MLGNLMSILTTFLLALGFLIIAPVAVAASADQRFHSRLQLSGSRLSRHLRGAAAMVIVAVAVFVLVAGIGAATSYLKSSPEAVGAPHANGDTLARLKDYARSVGANAIHAKDAASPAADGKMLPDVNTMIERLAARLETAPQDVKGWRMLGWSYYYTGRFDDAVRAYAKAVTLDPNSEDIKFEYEEAKAKAAEVNGAATSAPPPAEPSDKIANGPSAEQMAAFQAMPQKEREAAIRAMVDGLAARLESSPRDVEGWARLMRSRVVLGEKEVATTAFRKALDIFKGDDAASGRITAAARELGLKVE
ncbi:MAG: tetratricopeptide repeat protein [Hyphomicrobiaceae bacterium]